MVGQLEAADASAGCAREGAGLMTEELARHDARSERTAIHGNQQLFASRAQLMNGTGDQLFACPGLAEDEDRRIRSGDLLDREPNRLHRLAFTGQHAQIALGPGQIAQVSGLLAKAL